MDALSDVLRVIRLTGAVFLSAEFTAPWSVLTKLGPGDCAPSIPDAEHLVHYHLVTQGECLATLPGEAPIRAQAGDLLLFPRGDAHVLASTPDLEPVPTADLLKPTESGAVIRRLVHGGGGETTRMVCGFLTCDTRLFKPLLLALPRILKIRAQEGTVASWIETSLRSTVDESANPRAGWAIVVARLAELLFVEALRRYIDTLPMDEKGWLAGLRDPYVGRALTLMHERPAHPWTVEELGRRVALSRSALATRFAHVLGQSPMNYLASWRMHLAAHMLGTSGQTIAAITEQIGYDSEPSFYRAFKRALGMPPAAFRERARAASASGGLADTLGVEIAPILQRATSPSNVARAMTVRAQPPLRARENSSVQRLAA
jgi:AraC family transcriptional regulator, alkane utilization regulator